MRTHFADSIVIGWEPHAGTFDLPDPDDEHVMAAAFVGSAEVIVTENLKHFPPAKVPPGIEVLTAAEFARNTVDLSPRGAIAAIDEIVGRSGRFGSLMTRENMLDILESRYSMGDAVASMREYLGSEDD